MDDRVWGDDKSVEDLIRELRRLQHVFLKLDTTNMSEHTKGFVQGVLMSLRLATHPPSPSGIEMLRIIAGAYERKYGLEPQDPERTAEAVRQGKAVWEELKKRPDREEWLEKQEKYRYWPAEVVD